MPLLCQRIPCQRITLVCTFSLALLVGCRNSDSPDAAAPGPESQAGPADQANEDQANEDQAGESSSAGPSSAQSVGGSEPAQPSSRNTQAGPPPLSTDSIASANESRRSLNSSTMGGARGASASATQQPSPARTLRSDLTPRELREFLAGADEDMALIHSGRSGIVEPRKQQEMLVRIIESKLAAARRLASHPDAEADLRSEGARGELQALSHLASLSNVKAAKELETLAESNLDSDDPKLVADSRLVMIGFAMEALQNGDPNGVDRILDNVRQIEQSEVKRDLPTMIAMGQAREVLAGYGHQDAARKVRDTIVALFANSPNTEIAEMAAQLAGSVRYDQIDKLLRSIVDAKDAAGPPVTESQWTEAVETLIDESADLQTVQYLAGAALEFESLGKDNLVDATFAVLARRFTDPDSATQREARLAQQALQARRSVIGQVFDPKLPSVDGSDLTIDDFQGKVVLVPFWSMAFPQSLLPLERLRALQQSHPRDVAIVGVNMDSSDAPLGEFIKVNKLSFPSFRSATPDKATSVARKFGMVSMPFVVVVDTKGRVAAIHLTDDGLESSVSRLLSR